GASATADLRGDLLAGASATADLFAPSSSQRLTVECAVAVPSLDDGCGCRVEEPTLFYMPHCEASLYDALIAANWEPRAQLRRYAVQAEENRSGSAAKANLVLKAGRFAWKQRIDEAGNVDDEDWFARAFNETSWHFFEVDEAVDQRTEISSQALSFEKLSL
ncbi:protein SENSITIVITY TO RED LIGHT REDUCED 1-like, partial [Triticum dicoccoides]|uniref:protein SENSITIVITY TO RED LIGHT REDUCED 1-like n=1 Tax=Triticum dicoccoides TaxID=85692 RepID=UPI00189036AB